ncbi:MAG: arylsulfatase [Candidatus Hinthialibacter antarcticus]|nr:arylsulfatase [Candidatus Hinthialibacter antarcticus]
MNNLPVSRRQFIASTALGAAVCTSPWSALAASHSRKPNVLLIITDDQGWGDVRSHGNPQIDTPTMDSLAADGARFERFYVSPVCAPTRASLLTGRYHIRTGVTGVTRNLETMDADETTLAEVFQKAGYTTGCFGKWHNGAHYPQHPNGQGFDEFFGFCAGHWNNYFDTTLERNGKYEKTKGFISDVLTDEAQRFIVSNKDKPFFCYVPYNAPHSPWQVPAQYFNKYKAKRLDDTTACAYAMCENLDDNIKRLLDCLDDQNLSEDTIVIFMTDNGPNSDRYNGGMRGRKGSVDEGGVRVPCFIRWPGKIKAGTRIPHQSAHIDMLPTLAALCGVEANLSKSIDGSDLSGWITENSNQPLDRMLFHTWGGRGSVRHDRWLATCERNGSWRLYDMKADPQQKQNVAEQYPDKLKQYQSAYQKWYQDVTARNLEPDAISIGYPEMNEVVMPGHEALLSPPSKEGISYLGSNGWANDYITNWTDVTAYPYWDVEVVSQGNYEISLEYICDKSNIGSEFQVEIGGKIIKGKITKAHNPPHIPSPDLVPRKEVYEKEWQPLRVGAVQLKPGRTKLSVKALSKTGEQVMDLKAVIVRKVN